MALKLIASYSKRLGLPGYSSHSYSVTIETEITNVQDISAESARLYETLQHSVDDQIQHIGFVPQDGYGNQGQNGHSNGNGSHWECSDKQKDLILKLIEEHSLDKTEIDALAKERFGKTVTKLNKLEASGLIDELLERVGGKPQPSFRNGSTRVNQKGGTR